MRRKRPIQTNIPSQEPVRRTPYFPGDRDIQQFSQFKGAIAEPGKSPSTYVVSIFDARPINSVDWSTYSGTHPDDTDPVADVGGGGVIASTFFTVPLNNRAILRDWHLLVVPEAGTTDVDGDFPVFFASGASNFFVRLSFLVNGIFQPAMSNRAIWNLPFGDAFGNAYIIADAGDTIEMRVTGGTHSSGGSQQSSWFQAIMAMHGNLLVDTGKQPQFEPGTDAIIPVKNQ